MSTWAARNSATLTDASPARLDATGSVGFAGLVASRRQAEVWPNRLGRRKVLRPVDGSAERERHNHSDTRHSSIDDQWGLAALRPGCAFPERRAGRAMRPRKEAASGCRSKSFAHALYPSARATPVGSASQTPGARRGLRRNSNAKSERPRGAGAHPPRQCHPRPVRLASSTSLPPRNAGLASFHRPG